MKLKKLLKIGVLVIPPVALGITTITIGIIGLSNKYNDKNNDINITSGVVNSTDIIYSK